jgi:hypothetical protein
VLVMEIVDKVTHPMRLESETNAENSVLLLIRCPHQHYAVEFMFSVA